jgi:hypothetical protein
MRRLGSSSLLALLALGSCTKHEPIAQTGDPPSPGPTTPTPTPTATTPPAVPPLGDVVRPAPPEVALAWTRANTCAAGGPMSLTASDGTGLRLASFAAKGVVEGPLAFTELRLSFDNPEARQLEGRFAIQLPPGAALSRFAMEIGGRWQEGEVVERQAARVAYEDFLHRRQDPALLENDAGNRFEARVFPIAANARKEIVIAWSQALTSSREPYVVPVCGLPQLESLDVEVLVRGPNDGNEGVLHKVELHEKAYTPKQDLELRTGNAPAPILRSGDLAIARVTPAVSGAPAPIDELTILFDTSASRALDFDGQVERLGALVGEMARRKSDTALRVVAFDQSAEIVFEGPASGFGAAQLARLRSRGALGASDLAVGLTAIPKASRVLYVGDGIFTAGAAKRGEVLETLRTLASARGITRFDALVDGGLQDRAVLVDLARGELEQDGVVLDARVSPGHLVDKIERPTRSGLKVAVDGASWWWPQTVDGVQPGDAVLVYAELPADRALSVTIGDVGIEEEGAMVASAPRPLLQRARAQAKIEDLSAQLAALGSDAGDAATRLRGEIVSLSTSQRVLSEYTALLVLETEDDYRRFGIERTALADVLTVGRSGIEVLARGNQRVTDDKQIATKTPDPRAELEKRKEQKIASAAAEIGNAPPSSLPTAPGLGDIGTIGGGAADSSAAASETGVATPTVPEPSRRPQGGSEAPQPDPASPSEPVTARDNDDAPPPPADNRPAAPRPRPSQRWDGPLHDVPTEELAERSRGSDSRGKPMPSDPFEGDLKEIMTLLATGDTTRALELARAWRARAPGDVLALVGLGEALQASGDLVGAARAYGSIIDLFPSRTDLRRMAGERLEALGAEGAALALDTYAKAVEQRPDHPTSHRLYAYALVRAGRHEEAFNAILAGIDREYPSGRFAQVQRIMREDLGLIAAAWLAADPSREPTIARAVGERRASIEARPSTRFVLNWETDANDVDLHVFDGRGNHSSFRHKPLASGGELYADVTTGYGPECFAIHDTPTAFPYTVQAHYYGRGPMGYGMGKLQMIVHDGAGGLTFADEPFVLMTNDAWIDLMTIEKPGAKPKVEIAKDPIPTGGDEGRERIRRRAAE